MIAQFVVAAVLAAVSPATAQTGDHPDLRMDQALILAVGPRPPASGVVAFYADFDVAPPDGGARQRMYKLWMGAADEFLPDVGSRCAITYRREPLLGGNGHRHDGQRGVPDDGPHNVVRELDCGLAPGAQAQRGRPRAR